MIQVLSLYNSCNVNKAETKEIKDCSYYYCPTTMGGHWIQVYTLKEQILIDALHLKTRQCINAVHI